MRAVDDARHAEEPVDESLVAAERDGHARIGQPARVLEAVGV